MIAAAAAGGLCVIALALTAKLLPLLRGCVAKPTRRLVLATVYLTATLAIASALAGVAASGEWPGLAVGALAIVIAAGALWWWSSSRSAWVVKRAAVAAWRVQPAVGPEVGLTGRELEVLRHMSEGALASEDLGSLLGVAPSTAATHVRNLMRKLDVGDRAVLALVWPLLRHPILATESSNGGRSRLLPEFQ